MLRKAHFPEPNDWVKHASFIADSKLPPVGTRVNKVMGCRVSGVVVPPFFWTQSTDGTYKAPTREYVAVEWDDGTKGYAHNLWLERA